MKYNGITTVSSRILSPYIEIARIDHWMKNFFILPGIVLAFFDDTNLIKWEALPQIFLTVLSLCILSSSNYVINEILDAPMDAHHPVKKRRSIPSGKVNLTIAYLEWILLAIIGLSIAYAINTGVFLSGAALIFMGILYNVPPIRLKDKPYLDVLSESVNNPIRLIIGWFAAGNYKIIMLSAIMAYWMLGAFLMAVKRFAELRRIGSKKIAVNYRKSFNYYSDFRLLSSIIYYGTAFGLFSGIFIIRYKIELILSVPFLAGFISYYLHLGFLPNSPVQYPEKLYKYRGFVFYTLLVAGIVVTLLFTDVRWLSDFFAGRPK